MLCRITDEYVEYEREEYEEEQQVKPKTFLADLSLYDLMGQDFELYLKKNKQFGYDLSIESYDGQFNVEEEQVHPAAIEYFAEFCQSFLAFYNRAQIKNVKGD